MQIDLNRFISRNQTVGIALSGGEDSMALLHYMLSESKKYHFNVIAINIEHGIRGIESINDTNFVINYCKQNKIKLLTYSVNCKEYAKENKLSVEQAGRFLRYKCFYQAIEEKKCDKVATAHHLRDNFESVLLNLFRGTGLKGLSGIEENYSDKIIRPFLSVSKQEIKDYINEHKIPYVVDKTNFSDEYTRNALRLNVLPQIESIYPEAQASVYRFSQIAKFEDDYLQIQTQKSMAFFDDKVEVFLPLHVALLSRATIIALKHLGVEKDWEKAHIDSVNELATAKNSNQSVLKNGIIAVKEYDKICFYKEIKKSKTVLPFALGKIQFDEITLYIKKAKKDTDYKSGLYFDKDKIPKNAVIRTRQDKDKFTKFGGGTKSLNDYFTDKKVPLAQRDTIPLLAVENEILIIFNVAISDKIKVDENTKTILQIF